MGMSAFRWGLRAGAILAAVLICGGLPLQAQLVSGSITGFVKDGQQFAVAGAKVTLLNPQRGSSREVTTSADGGFVITPVQPGTYTIHVESSGFKRFEQTDVRLFANDRLALGDIILQVGAVSETITVEGSVSQVQAQSAERAGVLTGTQVVDLALISRSFFDLARTIPGIVYTGGLGGIQANGGRGNQNNLMLDGVTNVDTGSNGGALATTNIDMIAEFKVLTNAQQAEFGRSSGAQINVVTKSGTQDFHGTGYWFHRHEGLNANTWRNNMDGRQRQLYRYNYAGFNVGGPAYIPGKFNTNKDKFFFFIGHEWQNQLSPNGLRNVTVPTQAQRNGDYSATREADGRPVIIRDPLTNAAFPNNRIPANRISADGQKILNFYPMPNAEGIDPSFNFQSQVSGTFPRRENIYRGDYNINDKWRLYSRYIWTASQQDMAYGQWNADYNIPFAPMNFGNPGWSFITNLTTVVNPTLTNEFIFGTSKNVLNIDPVDDTFDRSKLGLSYRMPFPEADTLGLVQNWRYNVPNSPFTGFSGTPFRNFNHTWDITNNTAKIMGRHTIKAGVYLHYSQKDQTAFTSVNGNMWFNRNTQNPNDTNWAFSNALIGTYERIEQSNTVLNGEYRYWNVEWYLQDTWRVSSRLTLDYGMRFYWIQPQFDQALQTSSWNPALFDVAQQARLMQPGRDAAGNVVAINPLTGATAPRALTGSIINTGGSAFVGPLYANGMGRAGQSYPRGLLDDRGIHYAPRLGLAYRLMDKTVLRVGGGVFFDRFQGNPVFDTLPNPPSTVRPNFYFGLLTDIPPAAAGVFFPSNVIGFDRAGHVPTTYNWNVSIQRELPFNVLFDIGYVGSASNHNIGRVNTNYARFGSAWLPQNQDPLAATPRFDGTTTKQINLYRPYLGHNDANVIGFGASSNYHSLQVSANRRLGKNLLFGAAYTWSKALGVASGDGDFLHPENFGMANYGMLAFDRRHNLVFNYTYTLPKPARGGNALDNPVGRLILNNWQISGITNMISGQPDTIGLSVRGLGGADVNRIWTGSETVGPRVTVNGNPTMDRGNRGEFAWINTGVFGLPAIGSQGLDSTIRPILRPGDHSWDVSIFKNVPLGSESRFLQLRLEMFNAFNQVRFSDFNRSATFDRATGQITNLPAALGGGGGRFGFGALTGTRDPRLIQLAAKFYF